MTPVLLSLGTQWLRGTEDIERGKSRGKRTYSSSYLQRFKNRFVGFFGGSHSIGCFCCGNGLFPQEPRTVSGQKQAALKRFTPCAGTSIDRSHRQIIQAKGDGIAQERRSYINKTSLIAWKADEKGGTNMKKHLSWCLALVVLASAVLAVEFTVAASEPRYSFAFLPNTQNNTFQATMNDTFRRLCEEHGYRYVCLDPDYDLNTQLSQLADVAIQRFDAVFVIPVDSAGIRQGLEQLRDKGIPVFNVDTPVIDDDRDLVVTVIATGARHAGFLLGEEMVRRHPNGAKIAILDFPANGSCVWRRGLPGWARRSS